MLPKEAWLFRLNPPEAVKVPLFTMPPALGENWLETVIVAPPRLWMDAAPLMFSPAKVTAPWLSSTNPVATEIDGKPATPPAAMSRVPAALFRYAGLRAAEPATQRNEPSGKALMPPVKVPPVSSSRSPAATVMASLLPPESVRVGAEQSAAKTACAAGPGT